MPYDQYNPWYWLGGMGVKITYITENYGYFFSSLFVLLKTVGILGAGITLVVAYAQFASANPNKRAQLKDIITGKFLVLVLLFGASWLFSVILGILLTV